MEVGIKIRRGEEAVEMTLKDATTEVLNGVFRGVFATLGVESGVKVGNEECTSTNKE